MPMQRVRAIALMLVHEEDVSSCTLRGKVAAICCKSKPLIEEQVMAVQLVTNDWRQVVETNEFIDPVELRCTELTPRRHD